MLIEVMNLNIHSKFQVSLDQFSAAWKVGVIQKYMIQKPTL